MKLISKILSAGTLITISTAFAVAGPDIRPSDPVNVQEFEKRATITPFHKMSLQPEHVVELFTSQGCSSCPSANKFVSQLSRNEKQALVLSYGVTYWDYLGWKDTFADRSFTERQRQYMKSLHTPNVYTPQIVVNGSAHSPRYTTSEVTSQKLDALRPQATLSVSKAGNLIVEGDVSISNSLSIIRFTPGLQTIAVKAGENRGRTLKLENVVAEIIPLQWDGDKAVLKAKLIDGQAYAALFHDIDSFEIMTAAVLQN